MNGKAATSVAFLLLAGLGHAGEYRSPALRAEFMRIEPCPATSSTRGACPGYEVDHEIALCLTGPGGDQISNLQWLSVEEHRRKTRRDVELCRQVKLHRPRPSAASS